MTRLRRGILATMLLCLILSSAAAGRAAAQGEELSLRMRRDFGYASGTGDIQGRFSLTAEGPEDLASVEFLIDGETMGTVTAPPFRLQFVTDDYPLGVHTLSATGTTSDGQTLESNVIRGNFVEPGEGLKAAGQIILVVLGAMVAVFAIASLFMWLVTRGRPPLPMGAPRHFGFQGGTICPNCSRPYSIHFFALNLLVGRLDRCPHCGKWRMVRRASPAALEAAVRAELQQAGAEVKVQALSEEEKLHRSLEDSRFDDV